MNGCCYAKDKPEPTPEPASDSGSTDSAADAAIPVDQIEMAERLLHKKIPQISKRELANLIYAQYCAIENLLCALMQADPEHKLIKGLKGK